MFELIVVSLMVAFLVTLACWGTLYICWNFYKLGRLIKAYRPKK